MDFLSLFPTTSQQSSLTFSAYRQMGLLCWSAAKQNELLLVSAIKNDLGNDKQNVLFKCVSVSEIQIKMFNKKSILNLRKFHCRLNYHVIWISIKYWSIKLGVWWRWSPNKWFLLWKWTRNFGIAAIFPDWILSLPSSIWDLNILPGFHI